MTDKSHINQVATVIIANVIRRLMRNVDEEYRRGETILSGASLSQETRRIIEEERPVIAALYAIAYDGTAALRLNNGGKPFSFSFVQNKVVQMKPNPYREQTTMLLRELFTDFRAKSGDQSHRACIREMYKALRPRVDDEDERVEQLAA